MIDTYFSALWQILLDLSPALLAGLLLAGALHVFLPTGFIHRQMSRPGLASTLRAVAIGVPMPLCSCGVVPTALGMRKDGASKGATTGFLISTPQTGVDSVLVSATFLGWPFALFKVIAAAVTGLIGGLIADRVDPEPEAPAPPEYHDDEQKPGGIREIIHYAIHDLLAAIDRWIVFGVLAAALITAAVPANFFHELEWAHGITGMLLMLAFSLPLYVCTTGSVPIAASFVAAGMPTGTALVFLMAGPATNVATLGAVYRALGWKILSVYLGTVIVMSIGFALLFDSIIDTSSNSAHHHGMEADWLSIMSALCLIGLWLYLEALRVRARLNKPDPETLDVDMTLKVEGMSCQHCVANVKNTLEGLDGVQEATPDLDTGNVAVKGDALNADTISEAISAAGYKVVDR